MTGEASVKNKEKRNIIRKWILLFGGAVAAGVAGVFLFAVIQVFAAEEAAALQEPVVETVISQKPAIEAAASKETVAGKQMISAEAFKITQTTNATDFVGAKQMKSPMETGFLSQLRFGQKTLYLTFDDGPSKENTDLVLDVLKEKNVKATFFVIGEYVRKYPDTARRIVAEGHTIGIHCDVHDYSLLYASPEAYIADFEKAYDTVFEITGVEAKLFRFPGGSVNAYNKQVCGDIVKELEERGFVYFDWNASLEDAVGNKTPEQLLESAKESAMGRDKIIMLAHDRVKATADGLEELIDAFPEYRMKPLSEFTRPIQFRRFWEKN